MGCRTENRLLNATDGKSEMRLRINTNDVTFFCTRAPEARTDRDTGVPRMDRETGLPLWQVQLAALDETGGEVLAVTMAGEPKVTVGSGVSLDSLVAIPWSQGDRSGVAYRAARISVASGSAPGTSAPSGASAK